MRYHLLIKGDYRRQKIPKAKTLPFMSELELSETHIKISDDSKARLKYWTDVEEFIKTCQGVMIYFAKDNADKTPWRPNHMFNSIEAQDDFITFANQCHLLSSVNEKAA